MKYRIGLAMLMVIAGTFSASASLIMKINAAAKHFYFEGSDTGNGVFVGFPYSVSFQTGNSYTFSSSDQFYVDDCFVESLDMIDYLLYGLGSPAPVQIDLLKTSDITSLTGTGSSGAISYASFSSADQTMFESMVGDSFSLIEGTGYSSIPIETVAAIPEPGSASLLVLSGAALFLIRRLKKHGLQ